MSRNEKLAHVTVKQHSIYPFHEKKFNEIVYVRVKECFTETVETRKHLI